MSKNYEVIHYIQKQLSGFDDNFVDAVIRSFNIMDQVQGSEECMGISAILYIIAKKYNYNPELCYGLCELEGKEFYHAWLEIDDMVIDIAIYGNVNYNPLSLWNKISTPYIGSYDESNVKYGKYIFDNVWSICGISMIERLGNLEKYMDKAPNNAMWKLLCKVLDVTPSKILVDELRVYTKDVIFNKLGMV